MSGYFTILNSIIRVLHCPLTSVRVALKKYKINSVHKILVGKSDGRRTMERSSHRSENNIKTDLKEGSGFVDGIHVTQGWILFFLDFVGVLKGKEFRKYLRQHQLHTRRSALRFRFLRS